MKIERKARSKILGRCVAQRNIGQGPWDMELMPKCDRELEIGCMFAIAKE